jgi:hypothetical protein
MDFRGKLDCYITSSDSATSIETIKYSLALALPLVRGHPYRVERQLVEVYIHLAYPLYYNVSGFYTYFSSYIH